MAGWTGGLDYERLFDGLPALLLVLEPDLTIADANAAYLKAMSVDRATIVGRPLFEAFPEDRDSEVARNLAESFQRVRDHLVPDMLPIQRYTKTGTDDAETRYWAPLNAPVLAADGTLAWIVHRVEDVTAFVHARDDGTGADLAADLKLQAARMAAEIFTRNRLQEQNQILQAVLDSLDTAVVGCDRAGDAVLTNQAARNLFAAPAGDDTTTGWALRFGAFECTDEHGRALTAGELPSARLLRGEEVQNMLVICKTPGAAPRTFRASGEPVVDGGDLVFVLALHEVTKTQRAEQLKRCEFQVAEMLAKSEPPDHLIANTVELIGSMLGWTATEFWTVDEVGQVLRRQASWSADGRPNPGGLPETLPKGTTIPGRAWQTGDPIWVNEVPDLDPIRAALAVPIPSGSIVLGVLVCYSDNHETPDDMRTAVMTGIAAHIGEFLERRRAEQFAAELDSTRDEYISLVGHELRTPLTTIQAYTDMMRSDPDLPAEDRDSMLEVMHRNTTRLHALIAKLLDVAGTRAGHITLRPVRMNLAAVATACVDEARAAGPAAHIAVNAEPDVLIDGDPDRLRSVLDELLGNAVTWAPDGSTIGVTVHADEHTAVLAVSNTGSRIPADEHDRVFDQFYRTDDAQQHGVPGSGLGLTLVRAVVEQHGGSITVSEPDEAATTFTVRLPTRHPASPQRPAGAPIH